VIESSKVHPGVVRVLRVGAKGSGWWALVSVVCLLVAGCGGPPARDAVGRGDLQPVALPDLSRLSEPVQRQLRERFAALTDKRASSATPPAQLADAYGDLGTVLLAARLGTSAEGCFRHAQALVPGDRRWPYYLGQTFLLVGNRGAAIAAFERALALAPGDLPTLVWLGEAHLDDGRPAEAESFFQKAASQAPGSAAARFGAGRAALARQDYKAAAAYLEAALELDRRASAVHYPLAMAYRALGDRQRAEEHLEQRGEAWPALPDPLMEGQSDLLESVTSYERRGVDALAAGEWAAAASAFRKGLELAPDDPSLRQRLGDALYAAGDIEGATREFEEVVRRSPQFVKARVSLGGSLNVRGQYQLAIGQFSDALKLDPNSVEARLGLAEAFRVSGQPAASLVHYERAIALDPAVAEAWIGKAAALIALRRYPEARQLLVDARRVHPNHPKILEVERLIPRD
jgi:tetratricopeptide (TPR) repeat protein